MKFHIFGLFLCIIISVLGKPGCTNNNRCFIGGYQYFPGIGCYKLYTVKLTWSDAWKQCKDDNAYLAVIDNEEEYKIIRSMAKGNAVYIGIHDLFKKGIYVTLTDEDFVTCKYLKWDTGEPNNFGKGENCVVLRKNGRLNDIPCSSRIEYFICERKEDLSTALSPR